MSTVSIEQNENSFFTTGIVQGNEIVKADDFNFSFSSIINNLSKFSKMIFEADKNFVIGGAVSVYNGLNLKIAPLFGVCHATGMPFGIADELTNISIPISAGENDRIDIIEVKGVMEEYELQQRAFNDLDNDTITYQKVNTKTGLTLDIVVKKGTAGQAPTVDDGYVKLCEVHYMANSEELYDEDIYNITADVKDMENTEWTNDKDSVYNIKYISDVNERFRTDHNEDGTHKTNIIGKREINLTEQNGNQLTGNEILTASEIPINNDKILGTTSISASLRICAEKITELFNEYLKYGKFNFKGELSLSDILNSEGSALSHALRIGVKTTDDVSVAYLNFFGVDVLKISQDGTVSLSTGYIAKANNDVVVKSVTDALSNSLNLLTTRVKYLEENLDPTAATNRVLSKFTVSPVVVKSATTSNIELSNEQIIDSVQVTSGEFVLVKDQTNQKENGLYQVTSSSWVRFNQEITKQLFIISDGKTNKGKSFYTLTDNIIINETDIIWLEAIYSSYPNPNTVALRNSDGVILGAKPVNKPSSPSDEIPNMKFLADVLYPVGFVYTQYPLCPSPVDMKLYGTWEDVSHKYAGMFARVDGGDAVEFEKKVSISNMSGTTLTLIDGHGVTTGCILVDSEGDEPTYEQRSVTNVNGNTITIDSAFSKNLTTVLIFQNDQLQNHKHEIKWHANSGAGASYSTGDGSQPITDLTVNIVGARVGDETRSKNTTVRLWKRIS